MGRLMGRFKERFSGPSQAREGALQALAQVGNAAAGIAGEDRDRGPAIGKLDHERSAALRQRVDPEGRFASDLARRLGLLTPAPEREVR